MRSTPEPEPETEPELLLAPLPHRCTECNTSLLTRQGITHPSLSPFAGCTRWIRSMTFTKLLKYEVVPIICCSKWALDDAAASRVPTPLFLPPRCAVLFPNCSFKLLMMPCKCLRVLLRAMHHLSAISARHEVIYMLVDYIIYTKSVYICLYSMHIYPRTPRIFHARAENFGQLCQKICRFTD